MSRYDADAAHCVIHDAQRSPSISGPGTIDVRVGCSWIAPGERVRAAYHW